MEQQKNEEKSSCWWGRHCADGSHCHGGWRIGRFLMWAVILVVVFTLGVFRGAASTARYFGGFPGYSVSGPIGMMGGYGYNGWTRGVSWMMGGYGRQENSQKVFGSITSIDGNKITISDNGGNQVVVLSTPNTTITLQNEEVALSALKVGQNIGVLGVLNASNQFEARLIYAQ